MGGRPSERSPRIPKLTARSMFSPSAGLLILPVDDGKLPAEEGKLVVDEGKLAGEGYACACSAGERNDEAGEGKEENSFCDL
jgi:hypothetical protein